MGTIIKLFIAAVLLNAAVQVGLAEYKYYQFEDAVHEMMLFVGNNASDAEIVKQTLAVAEEYDVPVDAGDVKVSRLRTDITVNITYDEDVTLIPGLYTKNWTFTPSTSVKNFGVGRLQRR